MRKKEEEENACGCCSPWRGDIVAGTAVIATYMERRIQLKQSPALPQPPRWSRRKNERCDDADSTPLRMPAMSDIDGGICLHSLGGQRPCDQLLAIPNTMHAPSRSLFLTGNPGVGKTTMLVNVVNSVAAELVAANLDVNLRGFYTEECRQNGVRAGFDIVRIHPNEGIRLADASVGVEVRAGNFLTSVSARAPLARVEGKGSGPMVGKFVVDVPSIKANAIPSIDPSIRVNDSTKCSSRDVVTLVLLDEVGKMEMHCDGFLETVHKCLGCENCIVLGTLPTPRYGHVIQAVEDIRVRSDVTVVYVTKQNRDELRDHVKEAVMSALRSSVKDVSDGESFASALSAYLYDRDIGAPKMNKPGSQLVPSQHRLSRVTEAEEGLDDQKRIETLPCGPLSHESIPPKALLLGETASPLPNDEELCYAERSMWTVLGKMVDLPPSRSTVPKEEYIKLKSAVLSLGIAIWDVLSDVHIKGSKPKKKVKKDSVANPIVAYVSERKSIEVIAFIGAKAKKSFVSSFCGGKSSDELVLDGGRRLQLIVLPSSSRANSRMSVADKAAEWRNALVR